MRLDDQRESSNIENRRGEGGFGFPGGRQAAGGFGGGGSLLNMILPLVGSKFGIVGILAVMGIAFFFGNGTGMMPTPAVSPSAQTAPATSAGQAATDRFVARVLGSTEDTWGAIFQQKGERYAAPKLVLFADTVRSACGSASSATGPFYCPGDRKVYLDTSFFDELASRFGAPGDFAAAYVIAHEVGHHIQTLTGTSEQVRAAQARAGSTAAVNALSVRLELQADCLAGVWAAHNRQLLDADDFAEGVRAAQAIGDDRLQSQMQGRVVPDSFTHGTSAQRERWLRHGFDSGDPDACDTFSPSAARL